MSRGNAYLVLISDNPTVDVWRCENFNAILDSEGETLIQMLFKSQDSNSLIGNLKN